MNRCRSTILGATALGVYDMRVTPFHPNAPGVEVHAAVADGDRVAEGEDAQAGAQATAAS